MGFTTSYWQKERWSRRAADTLTSYGRCWNPSLGNWDVNWRVGVLSEEQTPQVIVFSGRVSEEEEQKDRLLCAQARRSPSRPVELSFSRSPGCIAENLRVASVRAARRKLVKLFRKPNSRFYWHDFTVRGHRHRRSTQETKLARAAKAASVKLGSVIEGTDPFPSKPSVLSDFA
jgi:hypothetical protein